MDVDASATTEAVPVADIARAILILRGHKVLLDSDLAALYGVLTNPLNQPVKRIGDRFPGDLVFRLTRDEADDLKPPQFATGSSHRRPMSTHVPGFDPSRPGALTPATE